MSDLVDIVLPSGEQATVPQEDLAQALAAGAHRPTEAELVQREIGGTLGQVETGVVGAGRTATFGLSDALLAEGANVIGGPSLRSDTLKTLNLAREANPYSNLAGEGLGLFVGPGGGVTGAGEAVEGAVGARVGEGLLGGMAKMGARGAAEGFMMGEQHQITEDTLGDHGYNAQAIFQSGLKDALLGGALGAGLGAGGHYLSGLRRAPGPASDAVLDEIAGVGGAGRVVREDAKAAEGLIADLQRTGATSEQATRMADEVQTLSRTKAQAGPLSGAIDDLSSAYAANRAGANPEMADVLAKGYSARATRLAERGQILDDHALKLKAVGDRVMKAERALNEVQFAYKADQMSKLVDVTRGDLARDAFARMMQDTDDTLRLLEATATKGGGEVAVKKLRKGLIDAAQFNQTLGRDASGRIVALKPKQMHELFIKADQLKRAIGSVSGAGKDYGLTEAQKEFRDLYGRLRTGLEDETVWGQAGAAQREWNETFSADLGRADDFAQRFSVRIDNDGWSFVPEMDAKKVKDSLLRPLGSEADSQQALFSTETWMSRNERRISAIEKYGTLDPEQVRVFNDGRAALKEFKGVLGTAKQEASIISRLEQQQLQEQGRGMGGLIGLVGDLVTRPLTTVERLASIRQTTQNVEKGVANGLEKFFGTKGKAVAEKIAPRPRADVTKEIGEIKELAGNPLALQERLSRMVGDLSKHAPMIAEEVKATAMRAVHYLAREAPPATIRLGLLGTHNAQERYSDQHLHAWEAKREAVLGSKGKTAPETLIADMHRGKLNRDAIQAIEFVSPKLFTQMQDMAREEIERMEMRGLLDRMPYQQRAAIAALLKVPPDGTWKPDFIGLMQAAKVIPTPMMNAPSAGPSGTGAARPMKLNTDIFATEAQSIEGKAV